MTDILLTHSYFLRFDPKQWKAAQPYPPLATLIAASVLIDSGKSVVFHDTQFEKNPDSIILLLEKHKPRLLVIYDDSFNYLTKMCLTNMREAAFRMIKLAREFNCKVVVSSSDATDHLQLYLENEADFVIIGEGEQTLNELSTALLAHTDPFEIKGIAYLQSGKIIKSGARENLKDLDLLPFAAWQLLNIEPYRKSWKSSKGYFSINMATTRGCPFKCNWCAKPVYGNRYNSRSPEKVIEELKLMQTLFHFDHIWFCDDIFGLKPGWVKHFAELVKTEKLQFRFKIQARVDLLLESSESNTIVLDSLAEAGCDEIWVGAESGSQTVLDAMDKGTTVEQIREATISMKNRGIKPCFFLQFGYPGENKNDIKATLDMLFNLMPHDIGISVSYPLPGTKFFENVKSQLNNKSNWKDSDELLVMFEGSYSPAYYKKLQRYVHREFRKKQAISGFNLLIRKPFAANMVQFKQATSIFWRIPQSLLAKIQLSFYEG